MPEFAQFVALPASDNAFSLPNPPDSINVNRSFRFDLANLDTQRLVVIMFKVAVFSDAHTIMELNGDTVNPIVSFRMVSPVVPLEPRSWHEIVKGDRFKPAGNTLTITGVGNDPGAFTTVSDIVFLYHAKTP